jgi:single-stranded-DNA-specific exonuclease
MANKRQEKWSVYAKRADFRGIGERFDIDQVTARIITNRDVTGDDNIEKYLHGTYADTHDPAFMKDMDKGCRIMKGKIEDGKSIRIMSDYDADGVTSNYILLNGLKRLGADVSFEIPDRIRDGYGMKVRMVNEAYDDGVDTIITCDNGISAFEAICRAKELGMTVIVTDHHVVPFEDVTVGEGDNARVERRENIVPADAVIDCMQADCKYPFKGLCGAGVAYKFIRHLYKIMDVEWPDADWLVDILAIGTQCDIMDLTDENRIFVKNGLRIINNSPNKGLKALIEANGLSGKKITTYHLGFVLGPCINAAGRLESAKKGLKLLMSQDDEEAKRLAEELTEINAERKRLSNEGEKKGIEIVAREYMDDKVLVVYMPELHESLAGLVAGKIKERYYRPTLVVTKTESGIIKGSGRSIEGYNMVEELTKVKELFTSFGGHEMAAGISLYEENLDELRRRLNENQHLTEEDLTPKLMLDCAMPVAYISQKLIEEMELLEPFGKANEKPKFAQRNLKIKRAYKVGKEGQYLKLIFEDENGYTIEGMEFDGEGFVNMIKEWFNAEECAKMLSGRDSNICLDVAYYPEINEYNGQTKLQIKPLSYQKGD